MTEINLGEKERIRKSLPNSDLSSASYGKLAEQVRRSPYYAEAEQIFFSPVPELLQARINAILDQKEVVLPSGGLKQGFFRFRPNVIPFNKLGYAMTFNGMSEFGEALSSGSLSSLKIDLAVIDSEALDLSGNRIGEGLGFTDLALALLREYGAAAETCKILSVIAENRVFSKPLPVDPWDVRLDGYVSLFETKIFSSSGNFPEVIWAALPRKRIRKIQPLWDLFREKNPLVSAS